ncbi:hypothetical protein LCGC14_0531630 [marine sediment metagenome]|uniref:Uncharacterized protein n=2 Tax=marine sediment metagenome TaxID=412755 RepID=A0A0F9SDY8_9ZZZZ
MPRVIRLKDLFINESKRKNMEPRFLPYKPYAYKSDKKPYPTNPEMINFSINIPKIYKTRIEEGVVKGLYPSRSEAIRVAIREFLYRELKFIKELFEE